MAEQKEKLERKSSKSRLSKQDEVEEVEEEEDNSPSSETSDATIVPAGSETSGETPGGSPENHSPEENKKLESQRSTDSDKSSPTQGNSKGKVLVRSKALRDDASPPPPEVEPVIAISTISEIPTSPSITISTPASETSSALLSPTPQRTKRKLEKDSSQSSLSDTGTSPCLSRDSSIEYKDSTGIDLEEFIKTTLNKNAKDRMILLKLEKELGEYIKDTEQEYLKFPQMSSYHRMLVHRCAAFFGLDHNVDQSGKCVVVNRTNSTRIPDFKFSDHVREDEEPVRQILQRTAKSFDDARSPDKLTMNKKSKSVEEREYEYKETRKRIFNQDSVSSQDGGTAENNTSRGSTRQSSARSSKEDLRLTDARPWSSTDSSGYGTDTSTKHKLSMTKASSFGGSSSVTVMSRDKSSSSCLSAKLSKTESASSSTSSNLGSPLARPPPIPSSPPPEDHMESSSSSQSAASPAQCQSQQGSSPSPQGGSGLPFTVEPGQPLAIWVASTFDSIPPNAMIINPQTGQPYLNQDGSLYRYQPHHVSSYLSSSSTKRHQGSSSNSSSPCQVLQGPPAIIPQVVPQPTLTSASHPSHLPMVNTGPPLQQQQPASYTYGSEQKPYAESSELPQQFSQMTLTHQQSLPHQLSLPHQQSLGHQPTLTHQSSTESMPDQHQPMAMPQQPQQQQQVYVMSTQPTVGQYMQGGTQYYPQAAQQQQQTQGGPPQSSVRLVYPHGATYQQHPQQSMDAQQHLQQQQAQHPMSVAQQQTPGATPQYNGAYVQSWGHQLSSGSYPAGPNVYQSQSEPNFNATYQSSQYNVPSSIAGGAGDYQFANTGGSNAPQSNYTQQQQQGFHTTPTSASHIVNFPVHGAAAAAAVAAASSTNLTYQPRSPPLQIPLNNPQMAAAAPVSSMPGGLTAGVAAAANSGQYMHSYSYSAGAPGVAPNHRGATPQGLVTFPNSGVMPTQSPPQHYTMVRPNMQMNLPMPSRTTPPPIQASGGYSVPLMAAAQPVKMISQLERKHNEMYSQSLDHPYKDASGGSLLGSGNQLLATVAKPAMLRPVPPSAPFRASTPLNASDIRLIGQPLQQFHHQPRLPLFTSRTRMSVPSNQLALPGGAAGSSAGGATGGNPAGSAVAAIHAAANQKLASNSRSAGSSSSRGKKWWSRCAAGSSSSSVSSTTAPSSSSPMSSSLSLMSSPVCVSVSATAGQQPGSCLSSPPAAAHNSASAPVVVLASSPIAAAAAASESLSSSTNSSGTPQGTVQLPSPPNIKVHHGGQVTGASDLILQRSLNAHGNHLAEGDSVVKAAISKVLNCATASNGIVTNS